MQDQDVDLQGIVGGSSGGIEAGAQLIEFAEAVVLGDDARIAAARAAVADQLGDAAMVDAAAVISNFQRMVRIADSSGIPLDQPVQMLTQGIREELGVNDYAASANSPDLPLLKRYIGKFLAPLAPRILARLAGKRENAR